MEWLVYIAVYTAFRQLTYTLSIFLYISISFSLSTRKTKVSPSSSSIISRLAPSLLKKIHEKRDTHDPGTEMCINFLANNSWNEWVGWLVGWFVSIGRSVGSLLGWAKTLWPYGIHIPFLGWQLSRDCIPKADSAYSSTLSVLNSLLGGGKGLRGIRRYMCRSPREKTEKNFPSSGYARFLTLGPRVKLTRESVEMIKRNEFNKLANWRGNTLWAIITKS